MRPKPNLPIGEAMTPDIAARILANYRDEIAYEFNFLVDYVERSSCTIWDLHLFAAAQIAAINDRPRTPDDPWRSPALLETTDRFGKRLYCRVCLWWETGIVPADELEVHLFYVPPERRHLAAAAMDDLLSASSVPGVAFTSLRGVRNLLTSRQHYVKSGATFLA